MQHARRALGCMYGQVIGDSLGSRYEFQPASLVQQMIIEDSIQSFLPMIGGGPLQLLPGQVSIYFYLFLLLLLLLSLFIIIFINGNICHFIISPLLSLLYHYCINITFIKKLH
uniref:ADP-ribosylglycohydrolase n=1 Tax=Elaeophora elaphi TaxID=1147741 RepID=A0A0R3RYJ3_9BILA